MFEFDKVLNGGFIAAKTKCNSRFLGTGHFPEWMFNAGICREATPIEIQTYETMKYCSPYFPPPQENRDEEHT